MISLLFVAVNSALLGHALFLQLQAVFGWDFNYDNSGEFVLPPPRAALFLQLGCFSLDYMYNTYIYYMLIVPYG